MRSEFMHVRAIINDADPLGLIAAGAKADEYDPEVEDLMSVPGPLDAALVLEALVRWFGEAGRVTLADAEALADSINESQSFLVESQSILVTA